MGRNCAPRASETLDQLTFLSDELGGGKKAAPKAKRDKQRHAIGTLLSCLRHDACVSQVEAGIWNRTDFYQRHDIELPPDIAQGMQEAMDREVNRSLGFESDDPAWRTRATELVETRRAPDYYEAEITAYIELSGTNHRRRWWEDMRALDWHLDGPLANRPTIKCPCGRQGRVKRPMPPAPELRGHARVGRGQEIICRCGDHRALAGELLVSFEIDHPRQEPINAP